MEEPERILFLAVPVETFNEFFQERFIQAAIATYELKLVIYDPTQEVFVEWKE
jgi:hypothetical protein